MLPRRYVTLTKEGLYYIAVLFFIVGGAVLREVNLLILLAGMMIAPMVISWRWVSLSLANLTASRRLPRSIMAGDPLVVEVAVANHRQRLSSLAVVVTERIERIEPDAVDPAVKASAIIPTIAPQESASASYRCLITRRGRYRFSDLSVSTRFPLGLAVSSEPVGEAAELIVCPRLGRLSRKWDQWLVSEEQGADRRSSRRGITEGEYYGIREWHAGDSQRWIHWRTSARMNKLAVRQFEARRGCDVAILLDLWQPPRASEGALANIEVAVSLAATLIHDLHERGANRISLDAHASESLHWAAPCSPMYRQEIMEQLATIDGATVDRFSAVAEEMWSRLDPGARLIVISTRKLDREMLLTNVAVAESRASQAILQDALWVDVTSEQVTALFGVEELVRL